MMHVFFFWLYENNKQEVYDWIGSLVEVPLHFTLQRGREVVRHSDHLQGDEVLDLLERVCFNQNPH